MTSRYIQPIDKGESREGEAKDCAVRALANASLMEYDDAHQILAYRGRVDRNGTSHSTLIESYTDAGFSNLQTFGTTRLARFFNSKYGNRVTETNDGITLKNFCKKFNKGRYIVVYSGHALAVVDGQIIDKGINPANKRIALAFSKPN
jgi:hypothetical protein